MNTSTHLHSTQDSCTAQHTDHNHETPRASIDRAKASRSKPYAIESLRKMGGARHPAFRVWELTEDQGQNRVKQRWLRWPGGDIYIYGSLTFFMDCAIDEKVNEKKIVQGVQRGMEKKKDCNPCNAGKRAKQEVNDH